MKTTTTLDELETELRRLIDMREKSVGIDLKRVNYQIAHLQNRIQHMMASEAI
ncbi:MAG: hypothetical protein U9R15_08580 [Chloroflexota bacterium]|nr:hypothetical protein [Chloroflexota bacterium]